MELKSILLQAIEQEVLLKIDNRNITRLENDSRKADPGTLFIAASGYVEDAHPYVESAYQKGCRCFVVSQELLNEFQQRFVDALFIPSRNIHNTLALAARNFYQDPSSQLKLVGITGTSGKTTTAFAIFTALRKMGISAGLIGTIEYRIDEQVIPATNTTPDILALNELMSQMVVKGVKCLIMEVSSHSLVLGRVTGLRFDIGAFTNFSQDHLDFHQTMEEYFDAKLKLFDHLEQSGKSTSVMLVNLDISGFDKIKQYASRFPKIMMKTFSPTLPEAFYYSKVIKMTPGRSVFELNKVTHTISMMGLTNVYNFTLASAILQELGYSPGAYLEYLKDIHVAGRMESVPNRSGISVLVDYAHKPDALEKVLETIRGVKSGKGRIITVVGCGGDRDRSKRPIMGEIGARLSDVLIITSDNPRTEDPQAIIAEIETGARKTSKDTIQKIENRALAIETALKTAVKGDVVLIAGKGHEDYQIIGKTKHHFSDREEVLKFFGSQATQKVLYCQEAVNNLNQSIPYTINYVKTLMQEGLTVMAGESLIQTLRDYSLAKSNHVLYGSVSEALVAANFKLSPAEIQFMDDLERSMRSEEDYLEAAAVLDNKTALALLDHLSNEIQSNGLDRKTQ